MKRIQCKWCPSTYQVRKAWVTCERSHCWQCGLRTWNLDALVNGKKRAIMGVDPADLKDWLLHGAKELED